MILRMPAYCRDFKCIAEKCTDNCCIGWEIDIDDKTADYYMNVGGAFGDRLRKGIAPGDVYSFILKNERCPFLNDKNLCDIILELGEDKLCHICTEHPRYYEWYDGITEGGVGLCCEAAARLILERGDEAEFWDREIPYEECGGYDRDLYEFLHEARDTITCLLRNKEIPLDEAVQMVLDFAGTLQDCVDNRLLSELPQIKCSTYRKTKADINAMLDIFSGLEPIDENWKPYAAELKKKSRLCGRTSPNEEYIRNIGIYFIWRYFLKGVFDEEILSKVKLSVISMAMVRIMFGAQTDTALENCAVSVKNYSKEIEYSEENLEAIYDMTYTERVFSPESLISFFE